MSLQLKYTEQELISRLKNNDHDAFIYLYDHYSGAVYGIIFKMIESRKLSEDVLQKTFLKICSDIENYDSDKERLFTWIVRIAKMQAFDAFRCDNRKKKSKILNIRDDSRKRDFNLISEFNTLKKGQDLRSLKNDQKQILDMAYFRGFTPEEISQRLIIPLETVKAKLRMAIAEVRKVLMK